MLCNIVAIHSFDIAGLISVGATDREDKKSWFSNYGDWVDVSAPGEHIIPTLTSNGYGKTQGDLFCRAHGGVGKGVFPAGMLLILLVCLVVGKLAMFAITALTRQYLFDI